MGGTDLHFHRPPEAPVFHPQGVQRAQAECPAWGEVGILHTPQSSNQRAGETVSQTLGRGERPCFPEHQSPTGEDEVGLAAKDWVHQWLEEERIITSVGVKESNDIIVGLVLQRREPCKAGGSIPEPGLVNNPSSAGSGDFRRPVHRAVVDDDDRCRAAQTVENAGQGLLFVPGWYHDVDA